MGKMLLGLAAAIAVTAVTTPGSAATRAENGVTIVSGSNGGSVGFRRQKTDFTNEIGRDRRRGDEIATWVNGGEWALYNNQAFSSNSYNDWWHDSPRSQPAWVRNNQDCARPYFQGNVLRC